MKQDHSPWDDRSFGAGANTDMEGTIVARSQGTYRDALNMRASDQDANTAALVKIGGEQMVFPADRPGGPTYRCIGSILVKAWKVSFWASTSPAQFAPIVQVDGVTVAQSPDIPYTADNKLQLHKAEECDGGTVFDARSGGVPLHWPIQHMLDCLAQGLDTYFASFSISQVQATATRPVNRPRFMRLVPPVTGPGLPGGMVWYTIRYVNSNGDRTPEGPVLGPVMIPWPKSPYDCPNMESYSVAGAGPAEVNEPTLYGAELMLRVYNPANFESLELVRYRWSSQVPDAAPVAEVAMRLAVAPGELSVRTVVDGGLVEEVIPGDETALKTYFIKRANSVRYVDYRVVYGGVVLGGEDMEGTFTAPQGGRVFPITKNIGTDGHANPVNHCYYRRFQSGERHGIGIVYYGPDGGQSLAQKVEDEVQLPSRRTPKTGLSLTHSDSPCHAANIYGDVTPTFEVFDHDNAIGKPRVNEMVNIMVEGKRRSGTHSGSSLLAGSPAGLPLVDGEYIDNLPMNENWYKSGWLKPFRPVDPIDAPWGLEYRVNTHVNPSGDDYNTDSQRAAYNPAVWAVTHHALGLAFTGVASPPSGAQGFSMVATKPAGRVVAQGLLMWDIPDDNPNNGRKSKSGGRLSIPDFDAGAINQKVWEQIQTNPGRFRIQCVSPLGFSSEQYASVMSAIAVGMDNSEIGAVSDLADILSVARVLWDTGQINPGNADGITPANPLPPVPTSGGAPDKFVGFGQWRNPASWPLPDGDGLFSINSAIEEVHATGVRTLKVGLGTDLYQAQTYGSSQAFSDPGVKAFHEPWYVVNIIEDGRHVEAKAPYQSCNHYQAFVSVIGECGGESEPVFSLVDERPDDIVAGLGDERYLFLRNGTLVQRYLNADGFTDLETILGAIASDGYWVTPLGVRIHGLFSTSVDAGVTMVTVHGTPEAGTIVEVRYNPAVPVKFFGDMVTAPTLATMKDGAADANMSSFINPDDVGTQVGSWQDIIPAWPIAKWTNAYASNWFSRSGTIITRGMPIPFNNYEYNGRYMVPFGRGFFKTFTTPYASMFNNSRLAITQIRSGKLYSIRQWKVLFDCEMRAPAFLSRFEKEGSKTWPNTNYIPRPYNFDPNQSLANNGVHAQYTSAYGNNEINRWRYGGFRSDLTPNPDYTSRPPHPNFAKPPFGYEEKEVQCNALVWSQKYSPLSRDTSGLKTFPVSNIEFLPNDKGAVQRLYSTSGNLFVIAEGAVYEVLIQKSTAYSPDGESFSMFAQDNFVGQVIPRSRFAGMPGSTWRSAAEGGPFLQGAKVDALLWYDGGTAYMLAGSQVMDISTGSYRQGLADAVDPNGWVAGGFDEKHNEYWASLGKKVPVYLATKGMAHWQGAYGYKFDDFLFADGEMYGFRGLQTWKLNVGDVMNGTPTMAWVKVASAPGEDRMEWTRIKLNGPRKPTRIEWYDEHDQMVAWMDEQEFGPYYIKKETSGSWAQWVPRKNISVDPDKRRIQGRLAYYKVIYKDPGRDKIVSSSVQVKALS